jgi:hypothetical protein
MVWPLLLAVPGVLTGVIAKLLFPAAWPWAGPALVLAVFLQVIAGWLLGRRDSGRQHGWALGIACAGLCGLGGLLSELSGWLAVEHPYTAVIVGIAVTATAGCALSIAKCSRRSYWLTLITANVPWTVHTILLGSIAAAQLTSG